MVDEGHQYFCVRCSRSLYAETPGALASRVNEHSCKLHPADFANWTADGIVLSAQYSGPHADRTRPEYTVPFGTTSRSEPRLSKLPDLTAEDRRFLERALVKW